ncbi:hypothetical protein Xen7305DRAFT_00050870 [Xenococcus sp. PCC 7305]|uniref:hypothetical protein n=1 Tax=Xenococcus sp. PCC 7305 TaxID=102125 RepID=UPI0002ABBEB1|nr:hypothetical protein [Xenococcus sp. PCC 7305]ELS05344.1 hypothetical protein Xen7305DRAFT_00050870 [Xenococcus sp. PCC 7305]
MSTGVVYVAIGEKSLDEACQSAASLKAKIPGVHTTIFCNKKFVSSYFDNIQLVDKKQYSRELKIMYSSMSPYDQTLFLDTDTYICEDISELFELLPRFDIALATAAIRHSVMRRKTAGHLEQFMKQIPASFSQPNGGLILFNKSPEIYHFFANWLGLQHRNENIAQSLKETIGDQPALREALFHSNLQIFNLAPEYNCRLVFRVGYLQGKVKILHGRHPDLPGLAKALNSDTAPRVFFIKDNTVTVVAEHRTKLDYQVHQLNGES